MIGRMDRRWAPTDYANLKAILTTRGYVIRDSTFGCESVTPSPEKMGVLIGSTRVVSFPVNFGTAAGPASWLDPASNEFRFTGPGTIEVDGVNVRLRGHASVASAGILAGHEYCETLPWRSIIDVESNENAIRFRYQFVGGDARPLILRLPDVAAANQLASILPKGRSADFAPQLAADTEFERRFAAQSPRTPVTYALVAVNVLVFLTAAVAGAEGFRPTAGAAATMIAWGSNFGPYTSDGDWWRLVTSMFIHFGLVHILANMVALVLFGAAAERLFGTMSFLLIYFIAGTAGSLASISWQPAVNSAGASAAIFGLIGALAAVEFRAAGTIPRDVVRSLRTTTLMYGGYALVSGFMHAGVDNAAHVGGLVTGVLVGLALARPITGTSLGGGATVRRYALALPLGAAILGGGFTAAEHRSDSLQGDALYFRTTHWFTPREKGALVAFNELARRYSTNNLQANEFASRIEADVLPVWVEAQSRFDGIDLRQSGPLYDEWQLIQEVVNRRLNAYQLCVSGLREDNREEVASCNAELKRIDDLVARSKEAAGTSQ